MLAGLRGRNSSESTGCDSPVSSLTARISSLRDWCAKVEQDDGPIGTLVYVVNGAVELSGCARQCRRATRRLPSELEDAREAAPARRKHLDQLVVAPETRIRHAVGPAAASDLQIAAIDQTIDQRWRADRDVHHFRRVRRDRDSRDGDAPAVNAADAPAVVKLGTNVLPNGRERPLMRQRIGERLVAVLRNRQLPRAAGASPSESLPVSPACPRVWRRQCRASRARRCTKSTRPGWNSTDRRCSAECVRHHRRGGAGLRFKQQRDRAA